MALIHTINIGGTQYDIKSTHYATCATAADTAAKVATIQNGAFTLDVGVKVSVKFTYNNSASSPTLNINSTGAKAIKWRNENLAKDQYWSASQIVDFVYDGTYWNVVGAVNSSTDISHLLKKTGDTMLGALCLTQNVNFGTQLPGSGQNGQLFFVENNYSYLPNGGSAGQYLVKDSDTDGDASWKDLPPLNYLPLTGGTLTGEVNGTIFNGTTFNGTATQIQSSPSTDKIYMLGTPTETNGSHDVVFNTSIYTENSVLFGAAWNDYAEYRICNDEFIPGQVVCENGDDTLSISSKRLQPGANIISDTFGFAIGETYQAKCPIAVAGRVLAYTYEPKEEFKAGDAVCAGPNGTVSKMTRLEIIKYPERIIGTVSAIPNYEYWGAKNIPVNNRIWIKI